MMKHISLLIKPASGKCNLRCKYCFYKDESEYRNIKDYGFMSEETLERIIKAAVNEKPEKITFSFQGGEPMLCGLEFYKKLIELEEKNIADDIIVEHSIQTNGIFIDDNWAEFFYAKRFLVGVSVDGTQALHDANRVDDRGIGTWEKVVSSVEYLKRYNVDYNLLCVVTSQTARDAVCVYANLKKLSNGYIQLIPCVEPLENAGKNVQPLLAAEDYAVFLRTTFDLWYEDWLRDNYMSIRLFDDYVHVLTGMPVTSCSMTGQCGQYLNIEADGSVFACDFYALDECYLGNINEASISELYSSAVLKRFAENSFQLRKNCVDCRWYRLCRGGCQKDFKQDKNRFCGSFREFFEHSFPRLRQIALMERKMYDYLNYTAD